METDRPRKYWSDLKRILLAEGSEVSEKIGQLKMKSADGKMYAAGGSGEGRFPRLIRPCTRARRSAIEGRISGRAVREEQGDDRKAPAGSVAEAACPTGAAAKQRG